MNRHRLFALVLAVVGCLLVWAYAAQSRPFVAEVLLSLALGIVLTAAIVTALGRRVVEQPRTVRDPRVIEDAAHADILRAFPPFTLAPGVCWHHKGAAAPGCDCAIVGGAR